MQGPALAAILPQDETDRVTVPEEEDAAFRAMQLKSLRPTAAYMTISRTPSLRSSVAVRKLLILDLNGTLLLRPKPRGVHRRPIHPRPYMPAFRSFLFHEAVKQWLEVRVWSSAQPHSVKDMVERCFAERRNELKAVWARDSLGLTADDYSRKVQTQKDLELHWSADLGRHKHSAETTLLLDDSPLKAHLQPYNHCCIPEYTQNIRNRDLSSKSLIALQKQYQSVHQTSTVQLGFDQTLIAVMGVLDELREQTNVAGWIHAGGLWAGREPPPGKGASSLELFSDSDSEHDASVITEGDSTSRRESPRPGNDIDEDIPMWFDHEPCFRYWVDRGTRIVDSLGINLEHGVDR